MIYFILCLSILYLIEVISHEKDKKKLKELKKYIEKIGGDNNE